MAAMLAVALAAFAACSWGTSDFFAGLVSRRLPVLTVVATIQLFGLATMAILLIGVRPSAPSTGEALASVAAGASGISGLICFYRALATGTMSIVAPIGACGIALPVVIGFAQGDRVSSAQAIGLALTVLGVVCASRSPEEHPHAAGATSHSRSIALALLAALGFGGYFTFAHTGARGGVLWLVGLSHLIAIPLVVGLALAGRRIVPATRRDTRLVVGIGIPDLAATLLYGVANRHGTLAIVAAAGSLYPVVTVVLARVVLHERVLPVQDVGIVAALTGVVLLAAG
jgi:drug/metabolite transporter (DMT)-like permease